MKEMDLFKVSDEELDQELLPEWPEEANEIIEPEEFVDYEEPEEYELESDLVIPGEEEDYIFEKGEKILVYSKKKVEEEKHIEKEKVIEIQEEVRLPQKDNDLILEKGDRIRVLEIENTTYKAPKGKSWDAVVKELERQGAKPGKDYDLIGSENFWVSYKFDSLGLQKILKKTSESKINEVEVLKEKKIDSKNIKIELEEILSEYVGLIEEPDSWTTNDFKYIEVLKFMIGFCAEKLQNLKFSNYVEVDKESSILINKPISLFRKFYKDLL